MTDTEAPPAAGGWRPADFRGPDDWSHTLTADEIAEIDAALDHVEALGLATADLDRGSFPLPALGGRLRAWADELDQGRGFVLVRGLPVERYGPERSGVAFWGLGCHLGRPFPQNPEGDLLGHVVDTGEAADNPDIRKYRTNHDIAFHVDGADVVGLLCLANSADGGASRIASSLAVRDRIVAERPELAPAFEQDFHLDLRDEQAPGEAPFLSLPLAYEARGRPRIFYHHDYFTSSQRHPETPRYTAEQQAVLDRFEALAHSEEFRIDMVLEPGDMQFVDNGTVVHARTAYVDDPADPRHLLRLWLAVG
ncbi:MAG: TauD/TfdA family dioxygenase [Acidimicrobiales bacterium]|nr:TauD/TfdA family dioxygenase [Acidimicrobiales bacterium]MCB9372392.1 TauD/TfdA family dioxygenase [Microthrixaceae bacterium]